MQERSLVSGSHGLLGSHLVTCLERLGHKVERLPRNGWIAPHPTYIFDMAAYGNLFDQKDKDQIYQVNLIRLMTALDSAEKWSYRAFVVTSTSSVDLDYQTYYSASKKSAEEYAKIYARETNKPVVIVRPSSVTGVGEQEKHLIPTLIRAAYSGEEIPFVPEPVHDFIDVDDFVEALWLVAQNAEEYKGQVFNISSGKGHSNWSIKNYVEMVTGKKIKTRTTQSLRPYDSIDWRVDNSKLIGLGWKPRKSIIQSIEEMVNERA